MRVRALLRKSCLGFLLLLLGPASSAHAAGQVSLSWDACSPIVSAKSSDGAHPYNAYVSVIGHSEAHKGFDWNTYLTVEPPGAGTVPDAWRFDAPGCQGSNYIRIAHLPTTVAKTCPAFSGIAQTSEMKLFTFDAITGRARIALYVSYPFGIPTADPNQRYFLGRMEFDHTNSVVGPGTPGAGPGEPALTCGGFERDMKLSLIAQCLLGPRFCPPSGLVSDVHWYDQNGDRHDFEIADPTLTFCGSCGSTPAAPSTWGEIKGRYRR